MSPAPAKPRMSSSVYDVFCHGRQEGVHPIDLTIGNPHLKPPACYYEALEATLREMREEAGNPHGYATREDPFGLGVAVARNLSDRYDLPFRGSDVLATVGATGALDVLLKTLLRHDAQAEGPDEVLVIAPFFVEYLNLVAANGGKAVVVPSTDRFQLDIDALEKAVTPRTRAIIVNSPNNPTGAIYCEESLRKLSEMLETRSREIGQRIVVVEDAVYESLVFTPEPAPSMVPHYPYLVRVNSYSKSLGIAGERLGHLTVHPGFGTAQERSEFVAAMKLNMRIRVVHAPLLQHRVVAKLPQQGLTDVDAYRRNVERLHLTLSSLGFGVDRPQGTFYLWATLPAHVGSELEFRDVAQSGAAPLLYLPGILFGGDAYSRCVRFCTCVPYEEIERACARLHEIFAQSFSASVANA
jgi:aspartate aminotransferase